MKNNELDYLIAKEKAVKYIGLAKKSSSEVKSKLLRCGINSEVADLIIEELNQKGYINDYDYAKSYISQEIKLGNKSKFEIKMHLIKKGIEQDVFDVLLDSIDEEYEESIIDHLLETKLKDMEENKKKAYLYRRGFNGNRY